MQKMASAAISSVIGGGVGGGPGNASGGINSTNPGEGTSVQEKKKSSAKEIRGLFKMSYYS